MPESENELLDRPEAKNLIQIYSSLKKQEIQKSLNEFSGKNFSDLKKELTELLIGKISPISKKISQLKKDISYIDNVLKDGSFRANEISSKKVKKLKEIIGF